MLSPASFTHITTGKIQKFQGGFIHACNTIFKILSQLYLCPVGGEDVFLIAHPFLPNMYT